jgi:hypothetical protein
MLSRDYVASLLSYDPGTGFFTWIAPRPRVVVGARAGNKHYAGYRSICIDGHSYPETRLAWLLMTGEWPTTIVDHRNRVRDDNRWKNLRAASRTENNRNHRVRRDNKAKATGVAPSGSRWRAYIYEAGKQVYLGSFESQAAAVLARADAEKRVFGDFAAA